MPDIALPRHMEPAAAIPVTGDGLRPAQLLGLLRRNWLLIAVCGVVTGAVAYVGAATLLPKQYSATGIVAVDLQSFAIPALEGALKGEALPDPMPQVRSQVQELQAPSLVRSVVKELNLEQDPEFNPTLRPPGLIPRLKADIENLLPGPLRDLAVSSGVLPDLHELGAPSQGVIDDMTVGAVEHKLSVYNDGQSMVINVQFMADTPQRAAAVVNNLIQRYIGNKEAADQKANQQANSTLTDRLNQVRDQVTSLEQQMQQERQRYQLVQTRAGSVGQQQLEDLSAALTRATDERAGLEANYARAQALSKSGGLAEDSSAVLGSSTVSTLRDREAAAERRVAQLSQTYGQNYPEVRAAEAQLGAARRAIAAEARRVLAGLGAQVQAARQHEADLRNQLAQAQAKASDLASVQANLAQLQKDADARRALYQSLLISAEQTQTNNKSPEQVGARIISLATPPAFPASPRPKLAGALGLLSGIAIGGFISLLRRTDSSAFTDPDDVAAETGLEVLAAIPRFSSRGRSSSLAQAVAAAPSGPEAEALRLIRNKLRFVGPGPMPRTLLLTSSVSGEGTSNVAAAFARTAALDGLRVLLAEADLENPSLATVLSMPSSDGMLETLQGNEHWREVIARDPVSGLECLLANASQTDTSRLLESMQLQNMIVEAREDYNLVVLDAQAVSASPHVLVLAHMVDAVVLVVEAGATSRADVRDAIEAIEGSAAQQPFIVLNKA